MRGLGARLTRFRLENGWSKRGLARRLGVSTPSIVRWEDGTAEPTDYNRYKIERLLGGAGSTAVELPSLPPLPRREESESGR